MGEPGDTGFIEFKVDEVARRASEHLGEQCGSGCRGYLAFRISAQLFGLRSRVRRVRILLGAPEASVHPLALLTSVNATSKG